jgi:deazaflavin-dependent oxidoreductase (nitroreductase family)
MPIPMVVARWNRVGLNRLTRRIAPWAPGLGVVVHQGRRSGRSYETPVNVFPTTSGVRIALTYGPDTDWVKNVLAANGCELRTRGRKLQLAQPKIVHDPARTDTRAFERRVLHALQVEDFLDLRTQPRSA